MREFMNTPRRCALLAGMLLLLTSAGSSARAETLEVGTIDRRPLTLELVVPDGPGPHPVIAWIHGGAWQSGSHRNLPGFTRAALEAGFAVASLDYRLTSEAGVWGRASVSWPAQLHDCKAGIRWLRANAETHRLDPDRIAAWGASAGGHLATMLGVTADTPGLEGTVGPHVGVSSKVAVAVDFFGPTDLFTMNADVTTPPGSVIDHDALNAPESKLVGSGVHQRSLGTIRAHRADLEAPWPELVARVHSASPVHQVGPGDRTPLYIAHGEQDRLIPIKQARRLEAACLEHGVPHVVVWYPRAGHGLPPAASARVLRWLTETMPSAEDPPDPGK